MAPLPARKSNLRKSCLLVDRTVNRNRRARPARNVTGSVTSPAARNYAHGLSGLGPPEPLTFSVELFRGRSRGDQ
jgi:hypothetical protein